jgi:hypothetical protein
VLELDHLAVSAETLAEGVEYVEDLLGVKTSPGGQHALMGTHNWLLSLGPSVYLEIIAIDPDAPDPGRVRWFDLDNFAGAPRLTNWIARTDDLVAAGKSAPVGIGTELALSRGDLRWRMLVPDNGKLPFGGAYPALISWDSPHRPAARLPDCGCRMEKLHVLHPKSGDLSGYLGQAVGMASVSVEQTNMVSLTAEIRTPKGTVTLR